MRGFLKFQNLRSAITDPHPWQSVSGRLANVRRVIMGTIIRLDRRHDEVSLDEVERILI